MSVLGEQAAILPEVDPQRPSVARIYNFLLGGRHNFAADRQAAAAAQSVMPELPAILRLNRQFLREAVRLADEAGIDQYLDLGCGIPSAGNTYDLARRARPGSRVVGVDVEPVAFVHGRLQQEGDPAADVLYADLLDARGVLNSAPVRRLIDLERPVCLLVVAVAHFIPDTERLIEALGVYREAVPRGSLLALTHACRKGGSPRIDQVRRIYNNTTAPLAVRDAAETAVLFGDWPILAPGLQAFGEWCAVPGRQCESDIAEAAFLVGVARKP
ncbi:SAM-dependent methyltransferase [Paractinoplanes lichenicola]|uniref:SAM-dependent methyltransferase n=1 Tax=Paractinoplanes lichenicola TaxID=2802976 RepID=A0ABS1VV07_9ACTN|nr:SAM-dependent methyltransferase [Actinoplanes lichenicola]MBL7258311.1 SAM-dependent methyltransferase [Actinoplanes lichenicola]